MVGFVAMHVQAIGRISLVYNAMECEKELYMRVFRTNRHRYPTWRSKSEMMHAARQKGNVKIKGGNTLKTVGTSYHSTNSLLVCFEERIDNPDYVPAA